MDTGLHWTVPDPACEELLTDGPMPSSLVETLETLEDIRGSTAPNGTT
ncbi:MAG: hypothetical protein OXC13_03245 [Caldilineaceae bacterium]|nr:hypothetical protein [Caldilineaceae bacterium]